MIFWTGIFRAQTRFWSKREYPPLIGNFESRFVEVILLVVGNQSSPLWSTFGCGKTKLWGLFLYVIFGLLWMVWSWLTMHTNYPPVLLSMSAFSYYLFFDPGLTASGDWMPGWFPNYLPFWGSFLTQIVWWFLLPSQMCSL